MNSSIKGPVNLGNPSEKSILEVAKFIIELSGSKSRIIFTVPPEVDVIRRQPDIKLAVNELGWKPKTDLREGLKKTISYFREQIK
jgi:UDP-glucuronate decarboxylase